MQTTADNSITDGAGPELGPLPLPFVAGSSVAPARKGGERAACFHCGEPCPDQSLARAEKIFCCPGCLFVHDLLQESGLEQYYGLNTHPGVRIGSGKNSRDWSYLDEPGLQAKLLDFTDGKISRITFHVPAIHCVACVWLLENLFRLLPGVGKSQVNFPRRELAISYAADQLTLGRLVGFLTSIGYEPELNFGQLEKKKRSTQKKLWLQIGVAGFAFGNIMLFSLPGYLGLDRFSGPAFRSLFGYLGLLLGLPVLLFSASDYWRSAWVSLRQRRLTLEIPIALGLAAIYSRSVFEVVTVSGDGYADSMAGLVFFLLCGRAFQQKTHQQLAFDRDYKSFFPLSVTRRTGEGEESVALSELKVGDRLLLRNGELIPADSTLAEGEALIDYSFVTGESEPVCKTCGEYLYAGGQQVGGLIELEIVKPVSQSYLTSLWNHEAFRKDGVEEDLNTLTNRYSRRFTKIVIAVACAAALFWTICGDADRGLKAFTSVLIVACPCALALAAPFALGTGQRLLGQAQVYLKNTLVLEQLAEVDSIVFDKTGTLTSVRSQEVVFRSLENLTRHELASPPGRLEENAGSAVFCQDEQAWIRALALQSPHPHARQIAGALKVTTSLELEVSNFREVAGAGIAGWVGGHQLLLGSAAWLEDHQVPVGKLDRLAESVSLVAIDGRCRGAFVFANALRPQTERLFAELAARYELSLLSGDNPKERERFVGLFGRKARLHFNQTPLDKLGFIQALQKSGRTVMMVGDGLNDAGALRQSEVGIAVVEKVGIFSPASDVILEARQVAMLSHILDFARSATRVVRASFGISALYNLVGIGVAAWGILSPLICAVLMPVSSLTVVLFACGMTAWAGKRAGIRPATSPEHLSPQRQGANPRPAGEMPFSGALQIASPLART